MFIYLLSFVYSQKWKEGDLERGEGDEDECEEEGEEELESVVGSTGARPRRMSEIDAMPNKVIPIPNYSSFFIFSPTNKWVSFILHFQNMLQIQQNANCLYFNHPNFHYLFFFLYLKLKYISYLLKKTNSKVSFKKCINTNRYFSSITVRLML